jgi:hypothetical protein
LNCFGFLSHFLPGLLLKTQAIAQDEGIGVMLVIMLVMVIVAALVLAIMEFRIGLKHLKKVLHNFDIIYPGCIHSVQGLDCVVSFPGKFSKGWDKVRRDKLSLSRCCLFVRCTINYCLLRVQVVRLGGKKKTLRRNLKDQARRLSGFLYGDTVDAEPECENESGTDEHAEGSAQLSVACVFFTPRKYTLWEAMVVLS